MVLTAAGGFAVDLGSWYWNAARLQRAADSAALAGAPFLPGNVPAAVAAATENLKSNGYENVNVSNTVRLQTRDGSDPNPWAYIAPDGPNSAVLRVELSQTYPTYFTSLLGYNNQYLMRSSLGKFTAPVRMGSPGNVLGANVAQGSFPTSFAGGRYWLNAGGPRQLKAQGDRYMAENCEQEDDRPTDNCDGGKNGDRPYGSAPRSHRYVVTVPEGITGQIVVQAFDPVLADVGKHCEGEGSEELGTFTPAQVFGTVTANEPANMYEPGVASDFCTDDETDEGAGLAALTLSIYEQGNKKALGRQLSTESWGTIPQDDNLLQRLTADPKLADGFRHWTDVGQPLPNTPGEYVVEATTPPNSGGSNRFALRVGVKNGTTFNVINSKKMEIEADKHLTIYTNATAADGKFYFAKLPSNLAGRTIDVTLFDIGDTDGGSVSLQLIAPPGAQGLPTVGGVPSFGPCRQIGPATLPTQVQDPCGIVGANEAQYNGHVVKLRVVVPPEYTCPDDTADNCWMSLQFDLGNTPVSNDTTTWEVKECGAPSRLLPESYKNDEACPDQSATN